MLKRQWVPTEVPAILGRLMSEPASARMGRRLIHAARSLAMAVVQRWAWSTSAVPVAVTVVAVVAYLVHRRGDHLRLGETLDSVLVTAAAVLDPDDADTALSRTPLRRVQHVIIQRLTRSAVARRRGTASLPDPATG